MSQVHSSKFHSHRWLPDLLKAHALVDGGTKLALRQEKALRGQAPACARGCGQCCAHRQVAVTAVELAGAMWHLQERVEPGLAGQVMERLNDPRAMGCPFLVEQACAVYPMRFLTCRQLFVFGRACLAGEDPWRSRRVDVLTPLEQFTLRAFARLLPLHGIEDEVPSPAFLKGLLREVSAPVRAWGETDPAGLLLLARSAGFQARAKAA